MAEGEAIRLLEFEALHEAGGGGTLSLTMGAYLEAP